jgi:UDP-2-acetamido-3-amino-2,3-dideoxy-glucuronate N-acetyltransferase
MSLPLPGDQEGVLMLPSMFCDYRPHLKHCGEGVKINSLITMVNPEEISIGDGTRLCDFVFLLGGRGLVIGKRCDVQPYVGIWGGGSCEIGDDVSLGMGTLIFTAQYDYEDEGKFLAMTDFAEPHQATYSHTRIDRHAYIGGGAKILGGVHIGEGAVVGLGAVVIRDVEPWIIVVGNPARKIGERPSCE